MKNKFLTAVQFCFVSIISVLFIAGLIRTVFMPKDINTYENRKANIVPAFTVSGFLSSDFQDGLDSAFSDQIHMSEKAKKLYNDLDSTISLSVTRGIFESNPDKYYPFNGLQVFGGDYILYYTKGPEQLTEVFDKRISNINELTKAYPELSFYTYYIEKETDVNFITGEKTGVYEYLKEHINTENNSLACYSTDSFEEFAENFYKTDHHWNHNGSYKAYTELTEFLKLGAPIEKGEKFTVTESFSGSKAAQTKTSSVWTEPMYGYKYDFPEISVTMNGEAVDDYGMQNQTIDSEPSYSKYYGMDAGETVFDTGNTENDNILVIGESYDNAVLKLLSTHFNKTFSIDLRNYEHYMGTKFDFSSYVKDNEIDRVLLIGNVDYFNLEDFIVE